MPDVTGTSTGSLQTLLVPTTFTVGVVQIFFPNNINDNPVRVGYGYVIARNTATPFFRRHLWKGSVHIPGELIDFSDAAGFTNAQYSVIVQWNKPNINWLVRYT